MDNFPFLFRGLINKPVIFQEEHILFVIEVTGSPMSPDSLSLTHRVHFTCVIPLSFRSGMTSRCSWTSGIPVSLPREIPPFSSPAPAEIDRYWFLNHLRPDLMPGFGTHGSSADLFRETSIPKNAEYLYINLTRHIV